MAMAIWLFLPTSPKPPGGSVGPRPDQLEEITHTNGGFTLWLWKHRIGLHWQTGVGISKPKAATFFCVKAKVKSPTVHTFLRLLFNAKPLMDIWMDWKQDLKCWNPQTRWANPHLFRKASACLRLHGGWHLDTFPLLSFRFHIDSLKGMQPKKNVRW